MKFYSYWYLYNMNKCTIPLNYFIFLQLLSQHKVKYSMACWQKIKCGIVGSVYGIIEAMLKSTTDNQSRSVSLVNRIGKNINNGLLHIELTLIYWKHSHTNANAKYEFYFLTFGVEVWTKMTAVTRGFCWYQNFVSCGCLPLACSYIHLLNHGKMCIKS